MKIEGEVTKGLGTATYWVKKIEETFYKKTKMKLELGTLNIKLEDEYTFIPDFIIEAKEYGGTQNVFIKKCELFEKEAYIVRAEKNAKEKGDHSLNIIEIVSDVNFRKTFHLKDGEKVSIVI